MPKATPPTKEWARLYATSRFRELQQELSTITRVYPDLAKGAMQPKAEAAAPKAANGRHHRKPMSKAAKAALSKRMKAMWAAKRTAKG